MGSVKQNIMNFQWQNPGMAHFMKLGTGEFTTNYGMAIRKSVSPAVRKIMNVATKRRVILEDRSIENHKPGKVLDLTTSRKQLVEMNYYPKLDPNKQYIFVCSHSFDEDIIGALQVIDRNAYALLGTPDQILHNPQMYLAWINGMIPVDKFNDKSRGDSVDKMVRVINNGTSVCLWIEGAYNHSENLPVEELFSGACKVAQRTEAEVVPIIIYSDYGSMDMHIEVLDPINLSNKDIKEGKGILRNQMGYVMGELIYKYGERLYRAELPENARELFMEQRRQSYLGGPNRKHPIKWTPDPDIWGVEISPYRDKSIAKPAEVWQEVWDSLDIAPERKDNCALETHLALREIAMAQQAEDSKYDVKSYMQQKAIEEREALETAKSQGFGALIKNRCEARKPVPYISLRKQA